MATRRWLINPVRPNEFNGIAIFSLIANGTVVAGSTDYDALDGLNATPFKFVRAHAYVTAVTGTWTMRFYTTMYRQQTLVSFLIKTGSNITAIGNYILTLNLNMENFALADKLLFTLSEDVVGSITLGVDLIANE